MTPPPVIPFPVAIGDIETRGASYAPRIASSRIVLFTLREWSAAIEKFARCNRYVNHAPAYADDEYRKTAENGCLKIYIASLARFIFLSLLFNLNEIIVDFFTHFVHDKEDTVQLLFNAPIKLKLSIYLFLFKELSF